MEIRARVLGDRSAFARAMLEASAQKLRGQLGVLERGITEEVEAEFRNRGGNLGRGDSGERSGVRMAGSFRTKVQYDRTFPIRISIESDAPHANILDKGNPPHTISKRGSGFLVIPGSRNPYGGGKTLVRKDVYWRPRSGFQGYARVGTERAVRTFLRRF